MITYHVELEFTQPVLGTANADPEIHERFIASKAPDAKSLREEVESLGVDELTERGTTVFPRAKDGTPFLWDYQLKGFFKDACGFVLATDAAQAWGVSAYVIKHWLSQEEPSWLRTLRIIKRLTGLTWDELLDGRQAGGHDADAV